MYLTDTEPYVAVDTAEYVRLLGFPRGHVLEGRALELASWARDWYATNGRPWVYAREVTDLSVEPGGVVVEGVNLRAEPLRRTLAQAGAHGALLVAVSAGPEIERAAHQAWLEEKPDEYFFLEIFGSAVVEHLTTTTGARLCEWADGEAMVVLPHYSPGYPGWNIADQATLFSLIGEDALPGVLEVFESGMLRPKKSLLAVFGVTRHVERVRRLSELVPCENCSYAPCQFRRAPYRRSAVRPRPDAPEPSRVRYLTNTKALQRWADERVTLTTAADGSIEALFRYDGTTCSNMGRPLTFHYRVVLGPANQGFPIRDQMCAPAPGDEGHRAMCEYLRQGQRLLDAVADEKPLVGGRLEDVFTWERPPSGAGCYCERDSRQHTWGLVLETIHYALSRREP